MSSANPRTLQAIEGAWEPLSPAQRRAILGTLRLVLDTFAPRPSRTA